MRLLPHFRPWMRSLWRRKRPLLREAVEATCPDIATPDPALFEPAKVSSQHHHSEALDAPVSGKHRRSSRPESRPIKQC